MIDTSVVPLGVDHAIGKAQSQQVLDRLFAQVMVDTVNVTLVKTIRHGTVDLLRTLQVMANRLFENDAGINSHTSGSVQVLTD